MGLLPADTGHGLGMEDDRVQPLPPSRQQALAALCETLLPALDHDEPGPVGALMRHGAADRGLPAVAAEGLAATAPHTREAVLELLDAAAAEGFAELGLEAREELLLGLAVRLPRGRLAVRQLKLMVFGTLVAAVDEHDRNPVWEAIGYPGPISPPPSPEHAPKTLRMESVSAGEVLEYDVCVIGSGAGGSVIAARLAAAGRSVLILERGGYRNEQDFRQTEASAADLYLRGGVMWSEGGEMGLLAGSTLGGGTVVNSMVCLRTPDDVRADWAARGVRGVDGPEFDAATERVWKRLNVNTEATHYNDNTELMLLALGRLGYTHERIARNASLDDDPRFCGYCNNACQQGCKRSTLKTYLEDAAADGARFLVDCKVERILVENGRAAGVEAVLGGEGDPASRRVEVRAAQVVLAAGAMESPAVLLRSGIGGPAVGRNLQLHPAWIVNGVYADPIQAWKGQIQSAVSFDLSHCEEPAGFLIESLTLSPALWSGAISFGGGAAHRREMLKFAHMATWHGVSHDHGCGRVVLGADGEAVVQWSLADPIDLRVAARAHVEIARMHYVAGAEEISTFHFTPHRWRRGEDFDDYLERLRTTPAEEYTAYTAHQMSSCRLGADPQTSVGDGRGQLHDTPGVWVGDASALPTAPGVNPMITLMALAELTAEHMLDG